MNIISREKKIYAKFYEISSGEVFNWHATTLIKTTSDKFNAVCLENGDLLHIDGEEMVEFPKAELILG